MYWVLYITLIQNVPLEDGNPDVNLTSSPPLLYFDIFLTKYCNCRRVRRITTLHLTRISTNAAYNTCCVHLSACIHFSKWNEIQNQLYTPTLISTVKFALRVAQTTLRFCAQIFSTILMQISKNLDPRSQEEGMEWNKIYFHFNVHIIVH